MRRAAAAVIMAFGKSSRCEYMAQNVLFTTKRNVDTIVTGMTRERAVHCERACDEFLDTYFHKSCLWCEPNRLGADATAILHISDRCLSFPLNRAPLFVHVCRSVDTHSDDQIQLLDNYSVCR